MAGVLGRWGDGSELKLILDVVRSLYAQAKEIGNGMSSYLKLRSYAAVLVFLAYGIGLTRAERWKTLHDLFTKPLENGSREPQRIVETLFLNAWEGTEDNVWTLINGLERRKTPFSDHLLTLLQEWSKRFVGLTPDFEDLFHRFELLGSLAFLERDNADIIRQELQRGSFAWMPVGRVGWRYSASRLETEFKQPVAKSTLLAAGFASNDSDFIDLFLENFGRIARRMNW
jgi:hypothetical protein